MPHRTVLFCAITAGTFLVQPVLADGELLQVDIGNQTQTAVGAVSRGSFAYGISYANYEDGRSGSVSVAYALPLNTPVSLKVGPTVGYQDDDGEGDDFEAGLRLVADRYFPTGFGSAYFLGEASTVYNSWFLLTQVTYAPADLGIELSRGASETYSETTVAVQKRLAGSSVSLRVGYKLSSEELFAGFSINTF